MIIYNGTWSNFIQWIRVMIVRWQSDRVNTNDNVLSVCDKFYQTKKKEITERGGYWNVAEMCIIEQDDMCLSLTFWVQLTILAILRFWYHWKGICLQVTVLKIKWRYSYFFMSISPPWNTCLKHQNSVYVKYKGVRFLSIHLWSIS